MMLDGFFIFSTLLVFILHCSDATPNDTVCGTEACKQAAKRIVESMNKTVDPCEDFYEYACGKWAQSSPQTSQMPIWSQFDEAQELMLYKLKDASSQASRSTVYTDIAVALHPKFIDLILTALLETNNPEDPKSVAATKLAYKACLNDASSIGDRAREVIKWMSEKAGGWPLLSGSKWDQKGFNWVDVSAEVMSSTMAYPLFVIYSTVKWSTATLEIKAPNRIISDHNKPEILATVLEYQKVAGNFNVSEDDVSNGVDEMLEFAKQLAKLNETVESKPTPLTIDELQNITDINVPNQINWLTFFEKLLRNNNTIQKTTSLHVNKEFVIGVLKVINSTSPRILANYILWGMAKGIELQPGRNQTDIPSQESTSAESKWKSCIEYVITNLPLTTGFIYRKKHLADAIIQKASVVASNIKSTFYDKIEKSDWIDKKFKRFALEKLRALGIAIGHPLWHSNASAMEQLHREVRARILYLQTSGARHVIFPGELQPPFFHKDQPDVLNYAGFGFIIGHELTHAIDNWINHDGEGNFGRLYSNATNQGYDNRSNCYVAQYSGYRVTKLDGIENSTTYINGTLTLGENIADSGGFKLALAAFKNHRKQHGSAPKLPGLEDFTEEQLFYLGFTNTMCEHVATSAAMKAYVVGVHPPHMYRVRGILDNVPNFKKAFNCPDNNGGKPVCDMW